MTDLNDINPHLALWKSETADVTSGWEKWVDEVAAILQLDSLDGDQDEDGYSLDAAHDYYEDGLTPVAAANEFLFTMAALNDEPEHDGQPTMYEEYQDLHGGDDFYEQWDVGYDDGGDW